MNFASAEVDMFHRPLIKPLLLFTLPIALSSILQQLFNAADTADVGFFGSQDALAAVGTNTEIVALVVTLSSGLSIGANILVAELIGKNRREETPGATRTAFVLADIIGIAGLVLGQAAAQPLLRMIQAPEQILASAVRFRCGGSACPRQQPLSLFGAGPGGLHHGRHLRVQDPLDLHGVQVRSYIAHAVPCVPTFVGGDDPACKQWLLGAAPRRKIKTGAF